MIRRSGCTGRASRVDSRRSGEQLLVDFLCAAFGGPAFYAGPDMKSSHRGLGITLQEWDIFLHHLVASFDALGVPEPERADVMAAVGEPEMGYRGGAVLRQQPSDGAPGGNCRAIESWNRKPNRDCSPGPLASDLTPAAPAAEGSPLDEIFAALSDPIRRGIVERLAQGPCSVTQLGAPYDVSAPAISKHLGVLERCGLIVRWKVGRVHYCRLVARRWRMPRPGSSSIGPFGTANSTRSATISTGRMAACDPPPEAGQPEQDRREQAIELQRRFRASPDRVFRAWTEPTALREWWCPPGWIAGEIAIDLRPGGRYRIEMSRRCAAILWRSAASFSK